MPKDSIRVTVVQCFHFFKLMIANIKLKRGTLLYQNNLLIIRLEILTLIFESVTYKKISIVMI